MMGFWSAITTRPWQRAVIADSNFPDRETARDQAEQILSEGSYYRSARGPGLGFLDRLQAILESVLRSVLDAIKAILDLLTIPFYKPSPQNLVLWLSALALILALVLWLRALRHHRLSVQRSDGSALQLDHERILATSAELWVLADAARAAGDWNRAIMQRFYSVIRQLQAEGKITPRSSHTVLQLIADARLHSTDDTTSSDLIGNHINDVRYGNLPATQAMDDQVIQWARSLGHPALKGGAGTHA